MSFKLIYNPEVHKDIQEAVDWYNQQQQGLGRRFFSIIKTYFTALKDSATHYAIRYDDIHCMPVKKFPYMIHYRIDYKNKFVKVEALFHTSQNPEKWNNRLKR